MQCLHNLSINEIAQTKGINYYVYFILIIKEKYKEIYSIESLER